METTYEHLKKLAIDNDWGMASTGDGTITLLSPLTGKYEPQKLEVKLRYGQVVQDRKANRILVDIGAGRGSRWYDIAAGATFKVLQNTHHPLRAKPFFDEAASRGWDHRHIYETFDLTPGKIRTPAMRGYFPFYHADELAVKVFGLPPLVIWGADNWVEATLGKWK